MREIVSKVYQFDELDERAKERARDWFREGDDFADFHGQNVVDDCAESAAAFGLDIRTRPVKLMNGSTRMDADVSWSGFSHQGQGAAFSGSYSYRKGAVAKVASEYPAKENNKAYEGNNELNRIVRELQAVQRRNFYHVQAIVRHTGRSLFLSDSEIDVERSDDAPMSDNDVETVRECMRDYAHYIYRQLEREYDYQSSDEIVDDNIRANEYEFTEEGKRA